MNSRNTALYSLVALLLATGCFVAGERKTVRVEHSWPAATIRHLEVDEIDGTININAGAADQIHMVATVHARGKEPNQKLENLGYFRTELDGDTLVIRRDRDRFRFRFPIFNVHDVRIDYDLQVPESVAMELRTVNGRIATRGVAGETSATAVNGEINIDTPGSSEVDAHTVNGRVAVTFVNDFHGAVLRTVNGRVTAVLPASASFSGDFSQVNGDVEAAFPLNIHSHPGNRHVSGEVNGGRYSLRITTVNGNIKVDTAKTAKE
jgi:DUF4097 and DUF4098 domain-containing protein YvlB